MSNDLVEKLDFTEQVGKLYLQGQNATQIAKYIDAPRGHVVAAIQDFKGLIRQKAESAVDLRDRLFEIVFESDESFRMVIDEAWSTVREAENAGELRNKISALKIVETATKSRADLVQKIGVGNDQDIIDQINESEEKQRLIIQLLKDIRDEYPEIAEVIAVRLSQIQSEVEVISVGEINAG